LQAPERPAGRTGDALLISPHGMDAVSKNPR
jgi:hypothetical protein